MIRTACLAAVALTFVLGATFAHSRPGTDAAAGPDVVRRPGGFRTIGAFGGDIPDETRRTVQLEMAGGQKLEGTIQLRPIIVDSEMGRYAIHPDKIKAIRFLKRLDDDNAEAFVPPRDLPGGVPRKMAPPQRDRQGNLLVHDPTSPSGTAWVTHGKVITTSGKEIIGDIHIPTDFKLELEFGTLSPAPDKLRILTLIGGPAAAPPVAPADPGRPLRPQGLELKKP